MGVLALITSCAELPPTTSVSNAPAPTPPQGYWNGDGVSGSPKIVVSIAEQRAYFYKGKQLVGESTVSTGKPGFGTPPGHYTVLSKDAAHVSTVFGDYVDDLGNVVKSNIDVRKDSRPPGSHYDGARMPFAMFFRGGYAMHQGYVPPYAASHGCIRLPQSMAETFFNAAPPGTPVIVKQEAVNRSVMTPPPVDPYSTTTAAPPPTTMVRSNVPPVRTAPVVTSVSAPPAPVVTRTTVAVRAPTPIPVRSPSPAPVRTRGPVTTYQPTPTPVVVPRTQSAVRTNPPGRLPSPTPTPTPRRW